MHWWMQVVKAMHWGDIESEEEESCREEEEEDLEVLPKN